MSHPTGYEPARPPDRLSPLPDAILVSILDLLSTRDAVRTSALSTRWRRLWAQTSDLLLDADNLFPPRLRFPDAHFYDLYKDSRDRLLLDLSRRFLVAAGCLLRHHCAPKIATFRLHFALSKAQSDRLDAWIGHAAARGVEVLDLDFNRGRPIFPFDATAPYEFPFRLFPASRAADLGRLSLVFSAWNPPPEFAGFRSLTDLELRNVRFVGKSEETLFESCPALERLVLAKCENLVDLTVDAPSLKYLWLEDWQSLNSVTLRAANLSTFEYKGRNAAFVFDHVPRLERLFLWKPSFLLMNYVLTSLPSELTQIKTLALCVPSPREVQAAYLDGRLPGNPSRFLDLRQLIISIPGRGPLRWIALLLKAAPFLQNLQLHMVFHWDMERWKPDDDIEECPHHHLETVEMTGFTGSPIHLDLAKFILNNAVNLDSLTIDPCLRQYVGDGRWTTPPEVNLEDRLEKWARRHRAAIQGQLAREVRINKRLIVL